MKKIIYLIFCILLINLVEARVIEKEIEFTAKNLSGRNQSETLLVVPIQYFNVDNSTIERCDYLFNDKYDGYAEGLQLIRVYDNWRIFKGWWFPSGIINIYDGCKDEDVVIHELAHQSCWLDKNCSYYENLNHLEGFNKKYGLIRMYPMIKSIKEIQNQTIELLKNNTWRLR